MRGFTQPMAAMIAIALATGTTLAGEIQYVSQNRFVSAAAGDESQRIAAEGFSRFNVMAEAISDDGKSMATASQDSILGDLNISASGRVTGDGVEGFSESLFNVNFELLENELVELTGDISISGGDAGFAEVRLRKVGDADVFRLFFDIEGSAEFSESFLLFAGEYRITGNTFGEFFTDAGDLNGDYNLNLRIVRDPTCVREPEWQCDGDVDGDGQVNPVDAGLVQAAFGSADDQDLCNYDVDCDGQINPVDGGIVQSLFGTCEAPRAVCP